MKILPWADFITSTSSMPLAATIGVFDGVHRGHQKLVGTVVSKRPAFGSAVLTFSENPKKLLHPQTYRGSLFSLEQKIDAFAEAGVDACVLIDFSQNFGTLSGAEFLFLLSKTGVRSICVGPNFRCGHKMDTNVQALADISRTLGMEAEIVDPVMFGGHPVSSSRIRNAVLEGRLGEAAQMLGRPHTVVARFEQSNEQSGRQNFAVADMPEVVLPPAGLYRVFLDPDSGKEKALARIEEGRMFIKASSLRGARRVAIIELVSQE